MNQFTRDEQERIDSITDHLWYADNVTRKTRIEYTFTITNEAEYNELDDALEFPLYYYTESAEPQYGYMLMREELMQDNEQFWAREELKRTR